MNEIKPMPFFILLFLFLGTSQCVFAQRGYKVINKAEKKIESKDYLKALRLLDRAEKMDYGFCGNARLEADLAIDSLRFVAFYKLNKYESARKSLDSLFSFGNREDLDSLKVLTYQKEYGTEFLKNIIDKSISNSYLDCNVDDCYGNIPIIGTEKVLKFKIYGYNINYFFIKNERERDSLWVSEFRKSKAYQLIKLE
jgi:hypothetical protein